MLARKSIFDKRFITNPFVSELTQETVVIGQISVYKVIQYTRKTYGVT